MYLPERLLAFRNRVLSRPGFQRWVAGFPLTRSFAQRRARELFDIVAGFVYSQVLATCVRLDLFAILAAGAQDVEALAARLDLTPDAARRLLLAATSLRLVERRGPDRFGLGELGAVMLGNPGIGAMVEHHAMAYRDLGDPVALLRGELARPALKDYWAYVGADVPATVADPAVSRYTELMASSQCLIADDVLDAYSLKGHRCLLDVGGGDGTFLVAAAKRWPHLRVILFDLPAVAECARTRFAREGLSERATAIGGDVCRDPLPDGADVVSIVRVLHDHEDAVVDRILRAASAALPVNGALMVAEPMSGTRGAEPIGDAYFGFYLLAMGSGRPRTPGELECAMRAAGFDRIRLAKTRRPILTRMILARRAA